MADPIAIGSLALGGLGALFGARENSRNAAARNALISQQNAEERRTNRAREMIAREGLDLQRAPVISGTGSRSEYIDGLGFKTTLSPLEQTIANANLQRMVEEGAGQQASRSYERGTATRRRMDSGADATAFRRERNAPRTRTVDSILGDLLLARRRNVNDRFDEIGSAVATQALRSGGVDQLGDLARERSETLASSAPTRMDATNLLDQLINQRRVGATNLQTAMEQLARRGEGPATQLRVPGDNVTASMRATAPQATGVAMAGFRSPNFALPVADLSASNLLNSSASALFGYGQLQESQGREKQLMEILANRQRSTT